MASSACWLRPRSCCHDCRGSKRKGRMGIEAWPVSDGCLSWPAEGICQRWAGTKSPAGAGLWSLPSSWQCECELNSFSAVVLRNLVTKLAYVSAWFCHPDYLEAPRYQLASAYICRQLTVPVGTSRRLVLPQVFRHIRVKGVVDQLNYQLPPPFRPTVQRASPICQTAKFSPKLIWEGFLPFSQLISYECPQLYLEGIFSPLILIASSLVDKRIQASPNEAGGNDCAFHGNRLLPISQRLWRLMQSANIRPQNHLKGLCGDATALKLSAGNRKLEDFGQD